MQNSGLLFAYAINAVLLLLLSSWPILALVTLLRLRKIGLPSLETVLWVIVILFVPVFGALAFLILQPGKKPTEIAR
ncbi:MAG: PLDc N-terminal domain-containing protein [Chloroflexi bacterium]|nr:PLDc N-terminal domain-containing protein [Chloroflexota bacterium]